jgi:hypothetical protein
MFKLANNKFNLAKAVLFQAKSQLSTHNSQTSIILRQVPLLYPLNVIKILNIKQCIIQQLVDNVSFTYTYILADARTRDAVIIDPVFEKAERDMKTLKEMNLNLKYACNKELFHCFVYGVFLIQFVCYQSKHARSR